MPPWLQKPPKRCLGLFTGVCCTHGCKPAKHATCMHANAGASRSLLDRGFRARMLFGTSDGMPTHSLPPVLQVHAHGVASLLAKKVLSNRNTAHPQLLCCTFCCGPLGGVNSPACLGQGPVAHWSMGGKHRAHSFQHPACHMRWKGQHHKVRAAACEAKGYHHKARAAACEAYQLSYQIIQYGVAGSADASGGVCCTVTCDKLPLVMKS